MADFEKHLLDAEQTVEMGGNVALALQSLSEENNSAVVIFLHGDLGAGKTTFSRGLICGLGHSGNVKSPTYTLVEPYELSGINAYHFDLYRLADPEELEFMGFRDYLNQHAVCLIEWPEKGHGLLPDPDLDITMEYVGEQRKVMIVSHSERGDKLVASLQNKK